MEETSDRRVVFKGPNITVYEQRGRFVIYDRRKRAVTASFTLKDMARWMEYVAERDRLKND